MAGWRSLSSFAQMPDAFCCDRSQVLPRCPMHFAAIAQNLTRCPRCPDERSPTLDNSLTTIIQPTCSGLRKGESVPKSPHPHQNLLYSHPNASADQSTRYRTAKPLKGQNSQQGDINQSSANSKRRLSPICSIDQYRLGWTTPPHGVYLIGNTWSSPP